MTKFSSNWPVKFGETGPKMWIRLTGRMTEFIPKVGCCMLKGMVCNFERCGSRRSGDGDNRRKLSTVRRLNTDQFKKIRRLRGSKNFISEKEKLYTVD